MEKFFLESPCVVSNFSKHNEYKNVILNLLNKAQYKNVKDKKVETNITKTDWDFSRNPNRPWVKKILPELTNHVSEMYKSIGYDTILITELWFQQYSQESEHGWHVHGSTFTNIYYLELPEDAPKTQIVNPANQKEIIELDVKEGDFACFPSFVLHKAPENNSLSRKTIISFNLEVNFPEDSYFKSKSFT